MAIPKFKIISVTPLQAVSDKAGTTSLYVTYSAYTVPSGSGRTVFQYSLNGGKTWTATTPSNRSFTINGVTNSRNYALELREANYSGAVVQSDIRQVAVGRGVAVLVPKASPKPKPKPKPPTPKGNTKSTHGQTAKHHKKHNKVTTHVPASKGKGGKDHKGNSTPKSPLGLHGYQWNLPPHQWSMPIEPSRDPMVVNTEKYVEGSSHKFRRGRIYWYSRIDSNYLTSKKYNTGADDKDPRYGFQFLWNPSQIETQVAMNLNVTPSFADKFVDVAGAFPSGEYLSFNIRIDRTNDFACIKSIPKKAPAPKKVGTEWLTTYDELSKFYASSTFYSAANSLDAAFSKTFQHKVKDLQKYGTLADIEYLYKAITGPGWVNQATARKSSDIGFLSPTLLRVDIGPLSYLGYVNSMGISHISFSKNMVPMISEVSIQFNLMATAGLATK